MDMEQRTCSELKKEFVKAVYCYLAYLNYTQSTSCEMRGWMKHRLESLNGRKSRGTKESLDESERGE